MGSPKTKRNRQLSPEEWVELGERILNGDQKAYEKLVLDYQPLMRKIAWSVARKADPANDGHSLIHELLEEGIVALCEAARDWDPAKGWFFPKYAKKCIWGKLMDQVGASEIIARTTKGTRGAEAITVLSTETVIRPAKSLFGPDVTLGETLEDLGTITLHEYTEAKEELKEARDQIATLLTTVTQECAAVTRGGGRHKRVVPHKVFMSLYGLDTSDHSPQWGEEKTQRAVGDQFGVSDESVRQAVKRIWSRISNAYSLDDLRTYISIVLTRREVEMAF